MDNDWNPKHFDEWGNEYVLDENGQRLPPTQAEPQKSSGFTHYDTSQRHCGMCGRLTCNGSCFK